MIKTEYLDINRIIEDKSILKLFRAVENHGGVLRFVGGAVRDVLAGLHGFELDLATDLSPDELVEACLENGLKTVPVGLKYATTGVVINNKILEVSSLRKINKETKYSSEFDFTDDWNVDASKRDLTINAVYADQNGNVFDYYNGVSDLENGIIRFIDNPEDRIKEHPIRIMRFFRFYSIFGRGEPDAKSLKSCVENKYLLRDIAIERVRDELFKIFMTPNIIKTLEIMYHHDILGYILPISDNLPHLEKLCKIVRENGLEADVLRRLFILYLPNQSLAENLAVRLHLTKHQKNRMVEWAKFQPDIEKISDISYLRKICYLHNKDFCKDIILFMGTLYPELVDVKALLASVATIELPEFSFTGKDLINLGIKDYSKISSVLEYLQNLWIESDFQMSAQQLQEYALLQIQAGL